jgi:hypothetical protein
MSLKLADRVQETTATTGTSTLALAGPTLQYQSFVSGIGTGNKTIYCIESGNGTDWEVGVGTVTSGTPNTLSRDVILASTNSGAAISLTGTSLVFCPMGTGLTLGALTVFAVLASEAISAGAFINIYNNSGTINVRNAKADDPAKFAVGFSPLAIGNGAVGFILFFGLNSAITVATPASQVWLSDSVAGSFQTSAPTTAGHIIQSLGPAVDGVGIIFHPGPTVEL